MNYSGIAGTGSYLPSGILTNDDLEKMVNTSPEWIVERTGIIKRHLAGPLDTTSSMAFQAANQALTAANCTAEQVELIIVATTTPDNFFPSTACLVQAALGVDGCAAFDLEAACAGFIYALSVADQFIRSGQIKTALVIGSEIMSSLVDWNDRSTCILFGDGAGAVVLKAQEKPGILSTHLHASGSYHSLLTMSTGLRGERGVLQMKGNEVFKIAVNKLSSILEETLSANHKKAAELDWLIPHQANLRIIQATAKKLSMPLERVVVTLPAHGNTSAASIPLALDVAVRDGRVQREHLVLLESFGAGLTWGSALVRY